MKITECLICGESFNRLSRHVRSTHRLDYRTYLLEHVFGGIVPLCRCSCGQEAPYTRSGGESFKLFVHGHHARGRVKPDDEKRRIGEKNSQNMKMFAQEHPDIMEERVKILRAGITEESEQRRLNSVIAWNRSDEGRLSASNHSKKLWTEDVKKMNEAAKKAGDTARIGFASGRLVRTDEQREKISASVTQKYLKGGFQWSRGKHVSPKLTGRPLAHYRSSWELRHMTEMDADPSVQSYRYEPMVLFYEHESRSRRYIPDFLVTYVDGRRELQEIGVKSLKCMERAVAKQEAARAWCQRQNNLTTFRLVTF